MTAYYNEFDKYAAQWLRNLIAAGHIAPGVVDERSIEDVHPSDLAGFTQCHFFAGIGVWSYALRRAGWPDDRPVWTGSCPCQPFSVSGKGTGFSDERDLWPSWCHLIRERGPAEVLGEQVASPLAKPWIDRVCHDVEALDYAFGAVVFPAAAVRAHHVRKRAYWVAKSSRHGWRKDRRHAAEGAGADRGWQQADQPGHASSAVDWVRCVDGKSRPVEPGSFPLVDEAPCRVGRLRAYGNAIDAEAARVFIEATMRASA
ncbi:DNA cytosine methyltransferase [Brevundimonas sp.]|jgi:DNA (cytosine-5)-methyltransferase 1|uniref:DNA cytosine methyltransferase n=1 Tax=Brevundimonas sp. TaxID=1871086 RepID=UPI0037846672